jgi:hypothetical protein
MREQRKPVSCMIARNRESNHSAIGLDHAESHLFHLQGQVVITTAPNAGERAHVFA